VVSLAEYKSSAERKKSRTKHMTFTVVTLISTQRTMKTARNRVSLLVPPLHGRWWLLLHPGGTYLGHLWGKRAVGEERRRVSRRVVEGRWRRMALGALLLDAADHGDHIGRGGAGQVAVVVGFERRET